MTAGKIDKVSIARMRKLQFEERRNAGPKPWLAR
jgi:hypothetical protein